MTENLNHLPDVVYLPRLKQVPWLYEGTAEGRAWVDTWRELHIKASPFTQELRDGICAAIEAIYRHASYAVPEKIYFEFPEINFLGRILFEKSNQFECTWSTVDSVLERIQKEDDILHNDLLSEPMAQMERDIAMALGRESAPSSRELFGEEGADLSAKGMRMDPVIETVNYLSGLALNGLAEKAAGWLSSPEKETKPLFYFRHPAPLPREQINLIMKMARRSNIRKFGNLSSGLFRQFAFLQNSLSDRVDFSSFIPWRYLIENVQYAHFGLNYVVINPLPSKTTISKTKFCREWLRELDPDNASSSSTANWTWIFSPQSAD